MVAKLLSPLHTAKAACSVTAAVLAACASATHALEVCHTPHHMKRAPQLLSHPSPW